MLYNIPSDVVFLHYVGKFKPWQKWCMHPVKKFFREVCKYFFMEKCTIR